MELTLDRIQALSDRYQRSHEYMVTSKLKHRQDILGSDSPVTAAVCIRQGRPTSTSCAAA